ncbi:MAG: sensor histidine kinase [Pseudolabrys sp.]
MTIKQLVSQVGIAARRGLRRRSPAAFAFAILCVAAATGIRMAIDLVTPNAEPFATYFPAVLITTLVAGVHAGIFATVLSGFVSWYVFVPLNDAWPTFTTENIVNICLFVFASGTIIWIAQQYRVLLRRLDEEENYRQVVVDELGHRVKNKLATIYAILRHELRGHDDIWKSVSGRLRALSAADDFLVKADGHGVDLRQILEMELQPYASAKISMRGEPTFLFAKLPTVLALMFHELATNAAKYGALSTPEGRIDISWRESGDGIAVDWVERGGPAVSPPSRRSFGSNLIERSLDGFGGLAKIEYAPAGVICRILLPTPRTYNEPGAADPPSLTA